MITNSSVHTLDTLIKYTMSKEVAEQIKDAFIKRSKETEDVSYLDCILFDTALEVLGIYQEYYGHSDDDMLEMIAANRRYEKQFKTVKTIDVTDSWKEVSSL